MYILDLIFCPHIYTLQKLGEIRPINFEKNQVDAIITITHYPVTRECTESHSRQGPLDGL